MADISIITKKAGGWHNDQLMAAATRKGLTAEFVIFKDFEDFMSRQDMLAPVVLWRASNLDIKSERTVAGRILLREHIVINRNIFTNPYITHKFTQQKLTQNRRIENAIPTYRFKTEEQVLAAVTDGILEYPFIAKPNLGAQGKGVALIRSAADLSLLDKTIDEHVFQRFIRNTGDWRVIMVGAKPLGVMKRIAQSGSHLNNISQGASSVLETDKAVLKKVIDIAVKASAVLGYQYCGVDVIRDEDTGEYYFLEVNSAPQWNGDQGFQAVTGVNVADEIMELTAGFLNRGKTPTPELVKEYYINALDTIGSKATHFAQRCWLWSNDEWARTYLDNTLESYIGTTPEAQAKRLKQIFNRRSEVKTSKRIEQRGGFYEVYPMLRKYNALLFKVLFAETIHGIDLRPVVSELMSDEAINELFHKLWRDKRAVAFLSTQAINFFYLVQYYYRNNERARAALPFDPSQLIELCHDFDTHLGEHTMDLSSRLSLEIYLLTHMVIGQSNFYARKVHDTNHRQAVEKTEAIIRDNYFNLTLDAKFEFLVAAALVGYQSDLKPIIMSEADASLAPIGNFVVDIHNEGNDRLRKMTLAQSEHRNVLYLMASTPFVNAHTKPIGPLDPLIPKKSTKLIVGRKTLVDFPSIDLTAIPARVDSGAYFSSIHAHQIKLVEKDSGQVLQFSLMDPSHPSYSQRVLEVEDFSMVPIKNSSGLYQDRYLVRLPIIVQGKKFEELFTLADRKKMMFPVLLGRTALKRRFVIDVSRLTTHNQGRKA